ncbi:MAG TPA: type 1 glutamine amidotransferase [Candidatus Aminicenantes bacterium]|nr:type 1 glutamine amidotransferase [Candidatus Aminicenantes bacterium]HRY65518.1 type 1 glutamine amidotransferase [Candidatus Aminicenantes bacterium]HRZ72594.1 type 1 glutamine amidotransferase [Candidatus Aminicenantes bacterium]
MSERRGPTVAIVDNSVFPDVYRPVDHWSRYLDVPWQAFAARRGRLPDPGGFSHIILTGSEASILEREPWAEAEADLAREAVARGTAVLGSCWGHQLLAFALAGDSHIRRAAAPEIGWIPIRLDRSSDLLGPAGERPFTFSLHFDEVCDLPPGEFEILASTEACAVEAFRLRGRPVWGLQCHPEIDVPTGLRSCRDMAERGFKGWEAFLAALARTPRDSGLIHRIVPAFLAAGETDRPRP